MKRTSTIALLCLICAFSMLSCHFGPEQTGVLFGDKLVVDNCGTFEPFEMKIDFVAYDDCEDLLYFRIQKSGRAISESDGISLQLANSENLLQAVQEGPVTLDLPSDEARLSLYLNRDCPSSFVSIIAQDGQLEVSQLELGKGGVLLLSGTFDLVDEKTGELLGQQMDLTVDAELSEQSPHVDFAYCP